MLSDSGPPGVEDAAELLGRLVACPSVGPAGEAGGAGGADLRPPFGEAALVGLLADLLAAWGAEVRIREVAPGRPNLVARFVLDSGIRARRSGRPEERTVRARSDGAEPARLSSPKSGRAVMLEAHSDTVQVDGMTVAPFEPTVRDGRLHGRGACDAKGPMAAMLLGIRAVLAEEGGPRGTVYFVSTCDEEMGASGARALVAEGFRADLAVIGEPTGLAVVHAHKGAIRWRIATHGVAAHSSEPSSGVNAISEMRKVLGFLEGPAAEALSTKRHPLLGEPTMSVGTIRGGSQVNVVPALCEIDVDRRLVPGESREQVTREITQGLDGLAGTCGPGRRPDRAETCGPGRRPDRAGADERFRYSLHETQWYPPFEESPEGPAAAAVVAACRKALGEASVATAPYATNAGFFSEAGIPCAVFGPGGHEQAHTADEYVELEQVVQAARVYAEIVRGNACS